MVKIENLTLAQLDALKEIGNIGAGNAATALYQLLGEKVEMEVPKVSVTPIYDVPAFLGGPEVRVVGIYLKVFGTAPGSILFAMPLESAIGLLKALLPKRFESVNIEDGFTEMQESALKEIGNIIAGAYLNALSNVTGLCFIPSIPAIANDMAGAILDSILAVLGTMGDYAVVIETQFKSLKKDIKGTFFLIPDPDSLKNLLQAIGVWVES